MVKLKPTPSKRQSTKQRAKITKRVAEHHRKARRAAKKNPQWTSRVKKDPGIPNSYPFKEQLLEEIRQKRVAEQEAKLEAKERAREQRALAKAGGAEESDEEDLEDGFADAAEHLLLQAQTPVWRDSLENLLSEEGVHTILVALDARDPLSWATPSLQQQAEASGKHVAYVLTRTDLVPREVANAWTSVLATRFSVPVFPVSLHPEPLGLKPIVEQVRAWGTPEGAGAAVCGMEYAGRTALSSALGVLAREEEGTPVTVYDTAHLIFSQDPGKDDEAAMLRALVRNKGPMQKSKTIEPLGRALVTRMARVLDLQLHYRLPAFAARAEARSGAELTVPEFDELCVHLARSMGYLSRRGKPSITPIMRKLVFDWCHGKMMYYATPPLSRSEAQEQAAKLGDDLPTSKAGLEEVVLPLAEWRQRYANQQIRLLPGPVDPRTLEWEYTFFVSPSERPPKEGKKAVKFVDPNGSEEEDEAEATEDESGSEGWEDAASDDQQSDGEEEEEEEEVEQEIKAPAPKSKAKAKSAKRKAEAQPQGEAELPQKKSQPTVTPGDKYNFFAHF